MAQPVRGAIDDCKGRDSNFMGQSFGIGLDRSNESDPGNVLGFGCQPKHGKGNSQPREFHRRFLLWFSIMIEVPDGQRDRAH